MSNIPRWQQGLRPGAYGNVWDAMTPRERRSAFVWDLIIAFSGAGLIWGLGTYFGL